MTCIKPCRIGLSGHVYRKRISQWQAYWLNGQIAAHLSPRMVKADFGLSGAQVDVAERIPTEVTAIISS